MSLLEATDLDVKYGDLQVLWDVSLSIETDHDIVSIVGPNGTGKTTLLKALSGLLEPSAGRIELFGEVVFDRDAAAVGATGDAEEMNLRDRVAELARPAHWRSELLDQGPFRYSPENIPKLGFVHVTEERNLFDEMTVHENLQMGAYRNREQFQRGREEVYELFPVLEERADQKAGTLSGGEQQMLAIGRGLIGDPELLALDEPSGALAPQLAERVFEKIERISEDVTILLVEQHVDRSLELADYAYLLENGRITREGTGDDLLESEHVVEAYLSG